MDKRERKRPVSSLYTFRACEPPARAPAGEAASRIRKTAKRTVPRRRICNAACERGRRRLHNAASRWEQRRQSGRCVQRRVVVEVSRGCWWRSVPLSFRYYQSLPSEFGILSAQQRARRTAVAQYSRAGGASDARETRASRKEGVEVDGQCLSLP